MLSVRVATIYIMYSARNSCCAFMKRTFHGAIHIAQESYRVVNIFVGGTSLHYIATWDLL